MQKIYLDQASTSFPKSPSVADAVYQYLSGCAVNVGRGGYRAAYSVEEQIFETREQLRRLFHFTSGKGKNVIFTQNITMRSCSGNFHGAQCRHASTCPAYEAGSDF